MSRESCRKIMLACHEVGHEIDEEQCAGLVLWVGTAQDISDASSARKFILSMGQQKLFWMLQDKECKKAVNAPKDV
jgi:hypothetical protein